MPNWNDVLKEISSTAAPLDSVRRKYLKKLSVHTNRNVIAMYSGWVQKTEAHPMSVSIGDDDKNALMNAVHKLDRSKGLDLILHTPGGSLAATESIVDYLYQMFGKDIRAIIPQLAMSAGTMIACSCKEIIMGKQSNIGPIDPQLGGTPAHAVIEEFQQAIDAVSKDPTQAIIWQTIIQKYPPAFILKCQNAIDWSGQMVKGWLVGNMFSSESDPAAAADTVITALNNFKDTKEHGRHIHMQEALSLGLKISPLEDDDKLQDLVLTVHHSFMHTFASSNAHKITENHLGHAIVNNK